MKDILAHLIVSSSVLQELQDKILEVKSTYTPNRAIFVFYGSFFIIYFIFFRWKLFALKHDCSIQQKRCKKNKKKTSRFWHNHRSLSWFLLQDETLEIIRVSHSRLVILCIVCNYINILFFIFGTIFLIISIFFYASYQLF